MITAEQRIERQNHLGSSDMAALFGLDRYKNAADVYHSKVNPLPDADLDNDAIRLGNALEEAVIRLGAQELALDPDVLEFSVRAVHQGGIFAANLDARIKNASTGFEAKTSGLTNAMWDDSDWGAPRTDEIPEHVIIQVHHQMLCADLTRVYVPALLGRGRGFQLFRVDRNDAICDAIVETGERFWADHVLAQVPPADTPSMETLKRMPRRADVPSVDIDAGLFSTWRQLDAEAKAAKKAADAAQQQLLASLGDAEAGHCEFGSVTYREQSRSSLDSKQLKLDHPDLYEAYERVSAYRVMRAKDAR